MKKLRFRILLLACWLVAFYIVDLLWEPISINQITYLFILFLVIVLLIIPHLTLRQEWLILTLPALLFLAIKAVMQQPLLGRALPVTVIEFSAIILTTLLLFWVRSAIHEFEIAVAHITIGQRDRTVGSPTDGQSIIYREIRRARNHQHPLALLSIEVDEKTIKGALDQMVKEAQQRIIKEFTLAKVSNILTEKLEDSDIVVQTNDHFVIILPETKPEDLPDLIDRLHKQVADQVGVELKVGSASLPQDGFTFEGLLHKATQELHESTEAKLFIEPEQLFIKHEIT